MMKYRYPCWAKRYDDALEHLNEVIRVEPNYAVARYELGIAYLKKGKMAEAVIELERARELESEPRITSALAYAHGVGGDVERARDLTSELRAEAARRYVSPFSIALAYAGIGQEEVAIDWLEKARAERSDAMAIVKVHPLLTDLHSNPRFIALTREVGYRE